MTQNTSVIVNQQPHGKSTEALIVVSQTVFFIVLFYVIKSYLLDGVGIMNSPDSLRKNAMQIGAIYFAIVILTGIIMLPLYHYEYAILVIVGVFLGISFLIYRDIIKTLNMEKTFDTKRIDKKDDLPKHLPYSTTSSNKLEF